MGILLANILSLLAAGTVTVQLAPDQPVPHVYVDDPVIVEFLSLHDTDVNLHLTIQHEDQTLVDTGLGTLHLRAGAPYWKVLEDAPARRGRYDLTLRLDDGRGPLTTTHVLCRIDRPIQAPTLSLSVLVADASSDLLHALRGIPLAALCLDSGILGLPERATPLLDQGFRLSVALGPAADGPDRAALEVSAEALAKNVQSWQIDARAGPQNLIRAAQALRRVAPGAPIAAVLRQPQELAALLERGAGAFLSGITLYAPSREALPIGPFRRLAEEAGYEGLAFQSRYDGRNTSSADGPALARRIVNDLARGHERVHVDASLLYTLEGFQPGYCPISALAHRLAGATYMGPLTGGTQWRAEVFRRPGSTGQWDLILWSQNGPIDIRIPMAGVSGLLLTDALNNPLPLAGITGGALLLTARPSLSFLSGRRGPLLARAAAYAVRREARTLLAREGLLPHAAPKVRDILQALARCDETVSRRFEFFSLIRALPQIEAQRRQGIVPPGPSVALAAALSRLARRLCAFEQETGAPFLEALEETLARCAEYQTLYLMGSAAATPGNEREDWILGEVNRLIRDAGELEGAGRPIEANALAALAEWRARSLKGSSGGTPADPT